MVIIKQREGLVSKIRTFVLTLFAPTYLSVSKDHGRHICLPYLFRVSVFPTNFFLQNNVVLRGKKHTALFQNYNWEKSSFPTHTYMYLHRSTQIRTGGAYMPHPPGVYRFILKNVDRQYMGTFF